MSAKESGQDLYLSLEKEVRVPKETILLDAFLPAPSSLPSAFAPPPAPAAEAAPAAASISQLLGRPAPDEEPEEAPEPPRRKPVKKRTVQQQKTLEEEIAEFMSRDNKALAPDND